MRTAQILVSALTAFSIQALADCTAPTPPQNLPKGTTATKAEIIDGVKAMKQYDADVKAYSACIDQDTQDRITKLGPDPRAEWVSSIKLAAAKKNNAAVTDLESRAAKYNDEIRAFKARNTE